MSKAVKGLKFALVPNEVPFLSFFVLLKCKKLKVKRYNLFEVKALILKIIHTKNECKIWQVTKCKKLQKYKITMHYKLEEKVNS